MKTIELPDEQAAALEALSKARQTTPEALVREAVDRLLHEQPFGKDDPAFGIWKDRGIDGVEYQRRLRAEWDHRP